MKTAIGAGRPVAEFLVPSTRCRPVAISAEELSDAPGGPSAEDAFQYSNVCNGYGWSDLQTWELAIQYGFTNEYLNETYLEEYWTHTYSWWRGDLYDLFGLDQSCWANYDTFFSTSWTVSWCPNAVTTRGNGGFDTQKTGQYYNEDFPVALGNFLHINLPTQPVTVTATAAVQFANGFPIWGTSFNIDTSSATYGKILQYALLVGEASGDADEPDCGLMCDPSPTDIHTCENQDQVHHWDMSVCDCVAGDSPILIDLDRDGLALTDIAHGVTFDLLANGRPVLAAWTQAGARDAFLVLDRDHNGLIDSSAEMFGNRTSQPTPPTKDGANGFAALAVYDGNQDGQITDDDAVFADLRLWIDSNHDGISEPGELTRLSDEGILAISLRYVPSRERDEYGNWLRFRGRVSTQRDALDPGPTKRTAIDVFLLYAEQ